MIPRFAQPLPELSERDDEQKEVRDREDNRFRRETEAPGGGLPPSSFFLRSLVDEVKHREEELGEVSTLTATCDCGKDKEVAWRCLDCSDNLCKRCWRTHGAKDHQIMSLGVWHKSEIPPAVHGQPISRMCPSHPEQAVCFFCDTCDAFICSMCAALDHRSAEHSYRNIDDFIRSVGREADGILKQFEKSKQHFEATENSIEDARNRLRKKLVQARRSISAKAEAEIAKIRHKANILTEKVDEIERDRNDEYDTTLAHNRCQIKRADQIVTGVNELVRRADDFELLRLKRKLMRSLEFQKDLRCEPASVDMAFIGVQCQDVVSDTDLGEILLRWQLRKEFGKEGIRDGEFKFARGVACFSNGDTVVCDTRLKRVSLFDARGRYKTSIAGSNRLEAPFSVAVNCGDRLFVTDKDNVKVFDSELRFVHGFTPSLEDGDGLSKSRLTGIAVMDEQRVAVVDRGRKVVTVHNLDGSLVARTPNNMVNYNTAINSKEQHLVFTNYRAKRLVCVDFKGKEVFNVTPSLNGKPASPTGVLCDDNDGSIYCVLHSGELGNSEVQHYNSNGAFIATVVQGLYNPLGLAVTPSGEVVVADRHSVKIFKKM